MKKTIVAIFLFMLIAMPAVVMAVENDPELDAECRICKEKTTLEVLVIDENGYPIEGVLVAPEWKLGRSGWNDFLPKEDMTDSDGYAGTWLTVPGVKAQVNYIQADGYECTWGIDTRTVTECGKNVIISVCTQDPEVPEFPTIFAGVALVGAVAGFIVLRKNNN